MLHPEVEWELAVWLGGGVRRGRESLRDFMRMLDEHAAHWRLKEVVELGDRSVARHEGKATTFSASDQDQPAGDATLDGRQWLCRDCFDEVQDHFRLRLME